MRDQSDFAGMCKELRLQDLVCQSEARVYECVTLTRFRLLGAAAGRMVKVWSSDWKSRSELNFSSSPTVTSAGAGWPPDCDLGLLQLLMHMPLLHVVSRLSFIVWESSLERW